jgi:hypothetical protein
MANLQQFTENVLFSTRQIPPPLAIERRAVEKR